MNEELDYRPDHVELGGGKVWDENRLPVLVARLLREWRDDHPAAPPLRPGSIELLPLPLRWPQVGIVAVAARDVRGETVSIGSFSTKLLDPDVPWSVALTWIGEWPHGRREYAHGRPKAEEAAVPDRGPTGPPTG
jgi:hypothetical protein